MKRVFVFTFNARMCFLLCILSVVILGACSEGKEAGSPPDMTMMVMAEYARLSEKDPPEQRDVDNFLMFYCSRHLGQGGEPILELEAFVLRYSSGPAAGYAFSNLVLYGIDSPFTRNLISRAEAEDSGQERRFASAELLYEVMKIQQQGELNEERASQVISYMEEARRLSTVARYNDVLAEAYELLGMDRAHFNLGAYIYIDTGKNRLYSMRELRRLYRKIEGDKGSLDEELVAAAMRVKADMDAWAPSLPEFSFGSEDFAIAGSGETLRIDFNNPESPVHGRPMALAVFSTSCGYCETELNAISDISNDYRESLSIYALSLPRKEGDDESDLDDFARKLRLNFSLLESAGSSLFRELDVRSVPVLFLFDDKGTLTRVLKFRSMANLEMKLGWYFDEMLQ